MEESFGKGQLHIEHQICCRRRIQGLSSNSLASERAPSLCRPLESGLRGSSAGYPFPKYYTSGGSSSYLRAYDVRNKGKAHTSGSDEGGLDAGSRD